jgi:acetyl esterase/lipase
MPRPCRREQAAVAAAALAALAGAGGCAGAAPEPHAGPGAAGEAVARVARCARPSAADAAAVRVERDVAFAAPGGDTLRLDLARPAGAGPHPVVVLLHGGGWEGGHRSAMDDEMRLLAARGYAAATASYRLTRAPRDVFPAAVDDARCAVRWLQANAAALGLDPARVGALGFSAGAHLASMLGVGAPGGDAAAAPNAGGGCLAAGGAGPAVRAVVSVAGPQDLRVNGPYTQEQARLVTNFLGAFPGDAPALAERASPIAHVGPRAAPFLLVHGTQDGLVPVAHARRMRDALRGAGVPATALELGGVGHSFPPLDDPGRPEVGCTIFAFLDRWLAAR